MSMHIAMDQTTGTGDTPTAEETFSAVVKFLGRAAHLSAENGKISVELKVAFPLAYSIPQLEASASISRSSLYEAIGRGELVARRVGDRRTIVTLLDAIAWLQALPQIKG